MPEKKPVVVDFPTIMDGYVVRWYADEDAANHHQEIINASRNGVTTVTPGRAADALTGEALQVHDLIHQWYAAGGRGEKTWAHVLTHRALLFRDVEPIGGTSDA